MSSPSPVRPRFRVVLYVGSDGKLYSIIPQTYYPIASFSSDEAVNDGRWHQVAMVVDGQGNGTLYLDGSPVSSSSNVNEFLPGYGSEQVGTGYTDPSDPATPGGWYGFQGQIGQVSIWSVARSADEVRQDMTTVVTGTEPGLEDNYPFDEGQGLTAHDQGPGHNDATLTGTDGNVPTWSSSSGLAIDLGDDGMTRNSASPRQGPNNLQNFPIIVTTADGELEGWLGGSLPDTTFRIDLFASAAYGPDGSGEAQDYLGSLEVTTDARDRSYSTSRSRRRRGCRSSRPRPPTPRATPRRSRPCDGQPGGTAADHSLVPGQPSDLLGRVGRWHRDPGPGLPGRWTRCGT